MFEWFKNQRFTIVLATFGFLLVVVSFFNVSDITKLAITPSSNPLYPVFILGVVLLIVSVLLFIIDKRKSIIELPQILINVQNSSRKVFSYQLQ
jgi:hypothetical protein